MTTARETLDQTLSLTTTPSADSLSLIQAVALIEIVEELAKIREALAEGDLRRARRAAAPQVHEWQQGPKL